MIFDLKVLLTFRKNLKDVYNSAKTLASFSDSFNIIDKEIRFFLKSKMYNNSQVLTKNNKGKKIIKSLFNLISKKPYKFLANTSLFAAILFFYIDYLSSCEMNMLIYLF